MFPLRRAVARCTRTAAAAAVVGLCVPAAVLAAGVGVAWAEDDGTTPVEHLTLSPSYGGAQTTVRVRAQCATGGRHVGRVSSPAFVHAVPMRVDAHGDARATAVVRDGLDPGTRYVVTANCSPTENLSASFAVTGRRPAGSTHAGYGGAYRPAATRATPSDGGVDTGTLALGGALAGVALAGYVLTARRQAARVRARDCPHALRPTEQGGLR